MKRIFFSVFLALIYPAFYTAMQLAVAAVYRLFALSVAQGLRPSLIKSLNALSMPVIIIVSAVITLLCLTAFFSLTGKRLSHRILNRRPGFPVTVAAVSAGLSLNIALTLIMSILPIPEEILRQYRIEYADPLVSGGVVSALCVAVVVPVAEEVVFRGLSFGSLRGKMPLWASLTAQALIFALFHFSVLQIAYVFVSAIALGLIYHRTESILASIIFHAAFNGGSLLLSALISETVTPLVFTMAVFGSLLVYTLSMRFIR